MANNKLKKIISSVPYFAGVYLMKDKSGKVIYVGKAKSLKRRLNSYLGRDLGAKTIALMSKVADIEYRVCRNESMALLLEAALIRFHRPRYNVSLRDDKSFPFVKITNEEFPAVYITRKRECDRAEYIGPYTNAKLLRGALKIIRRYLPFRSCKTLPKKACIYYRLGLSPAPCIGKVSRDEYSKTIDKIRLILEGQTDTLINKLSRELEEKSANLQFEEAAGIRDQIYALSALGEGRKGYSSRYELEDLRNLLRLERLPERIEAFDISNISGQEATGSMVSFWRGFPDKDNYRRFRIKTVESIDDYGMLREVIRRRYSRVKEEALPLADLVLIDGGKSHLLVACNEMEGLGIKIPVVSIAKERENIYTKESARPIKLRTDTPALNLIRKVRNEAHRFALSYHHLLRRKKVIGK